MEKVVNITIGKAVFYIEEDAYNELSEYLDSIENYFAKDRNKSEILEDIESGIAEKFLAKGKSEKQAVLLKDVEDVINQMGSLEDFKGVEPEDNVDDEEGKVKKKLYRDGDDVIIAGVASGAASYFNIDTAIVRLIFFLSVFLGGLGVIVYVILWIVVPVARTTTQKYEMRSGGVTLKEIEKRVKDGVNNLKKKDMEVVKNKTAEVSGRVRGFINRCLSFFGSIFWWCVRGLRNFVGIVGIVIGVAGVALLSFSLVWLLSGGSFPFSSLKLEDFVTLNTGFYGLFVTAGYLLILLPFVGVFLLGLSVLKKRFVFSLATFVIILMLWFGALGAFFSIGFNQMETIFDRAKEFVEDVDNYRFEKYTDQGGEFLEMVDDRI